MANSIALVKKYVDFLDEVYKTESCTNILENSALMTRQGANANEILIPKISMDGLADYSRSSGYVDAVNSKICLNLMIIDSQNIPKNRA